MIIANSASVQVQNLRLGIEHRPVQLPGYSERDLVLIGLASNPLAVEERPIHRLGR